MDVLWWSLTVILMLAGLAGTVLPLLPAHILILAGALLHRLTLGPEQSVGWWTIGGLVVLTIIAQVVDFVSGTLGAKYYGATRGGAIGGLIGGVVGIFFGLPGLILGPLFGVLAGELIGGRTLLPAAKSSWGTFLGTIAGMAAKIVLAFWMIGWFVFAVIF